MKQQSIVTHWRGGESERGRMIYCDRGTCSGGATFCMEVGKGWDKAQGTSTEWKAGEEVKQGTEN